MLINGTRIDSTPTVGRLHHMDLDPFGQGAYSDGKQGGMWFGAEFDAGVTGAATYFEIVLPLAVGRLTAISVVGYGAAAPVHTITITDPQGRDWSFNITGDTDNCIAAAIPDLVGQLTFKVTATNMAGERVRYGLYFTDNVVVLNGSVPTGTGFRHITAGAEDAATKLVDTADINADQVTYAKIQNVSATDKVLGRSTAGAGDVEEIPCTAGGRGLIALALGSQGKMLRVNSGATAPEYFFHKAAHDVRDGTIFQTFDRATGSRVFALTTGTIYLDAIPLRIGDVITSLGVALSVGATTPTNWWFVLCNSSRVVLAVTADQTTTATGTGEVAVNLGSPYTVTADGQYYVGVMFAAAVAPTIILDGTLGAVSTALKAVVPILCGTSDVGQTTPPAVSATLGAITASQTMFWMRGK